MAVIHESHKTDYLVPRLVQGKEGKKIEKGKKKKNIIFSTSKQNLQ